MIALQAWHASAVETLSSILDDQDVHLDVTVVITDTTLLDPHLAEVLARDPRAQVLTSSDSDQASLAAAVGVARGDYVLFLEGEDLVPAGALAALLRAARTADADLALGRYVRFHPTRLSTSLDDVVDLDRLGPMTLAVAPGLVRADIVGCMLMRRDLAERVCLELDAGTAESVVATSALLGASRIAAVPLAVHIRRLRAGVDRERDLQRRVAADIERARRLTAAGASVALVDLSTSQIHGASWDQVKAFTSRPARDARDREQRVHLAGELKQLLDLVPAPVLGSAEDRNRWEAIQQMSKGRWSQAATRTTPRPAFHVRAARGGVRRVRGALRRVKKILLPAAAVVVVGAVIVVCVAGIIGSVTVAWVAGSLGVLAAFCATVLMHRRTLQQLRSSETRLFRVEREFGRTRRTLTQLESLPTSLARLEADETARADDRVNAHEHLSQRLGRIESRTPERTRKLVTRDAFAIASLTRRLDVALDIGGFSDWSATPEMFAYLAATIPDLPDGTTVIEFGGGLSTLWLSLANAQRERPIRIISLDHDEDWALETRRLLARHERTDVELRVAALQPLQIGDWEGEWYDAATIADVGPISLALVDGPPGTTSDRARQPALPMIRSKVADSGALVVLDDINRSDEQQIRDEWLEIDGVSINRALGRAVVLKVAPEQP
ncbi:hypothetical protein ACFC1I_18060 [Microbacterium sp. NPDC056044]|uniref:hypothetical protein n=1 Tax=Microbacterium sp. NPDC056044 TaxID=3345690 RepID=UPI0035DA27A3